MGGRCFLGGVLLVLGLGGSAAAQDSSPNSLERLVEDDFRIRLPIDDCTVPDAARFLARRYRLLLGVEFMRVDCIKVRSMRNRREPELVNLRLVTVRDALDKLAQLDPRYRWIESDGVIVVRPVDAWADPKNVLNYTTASFTLEDVNLGEALDAVVSAATGVRRDTGGLLATRTEQGARRFSVKTGATSVGGALEAIVRAHGDMWWEVGEQPEGLRMISLYTFDESGLGATVRPPR